MLDLESDLGTGVESRFGDESDTLALAAQAFLEDASHLRVIPWNSRLSMNVANYAIEFTDENVVGQSENDGGLATSHKYEFTFRTDPNFVLVQCNQLEAAHRQIFFRVSRHDDGGIRLETFPAEETVTRIDACRVAGSSRL